jgi:hypothetical protein
MDQVLVAGLFPGEVRPLAGTTTRIISSNRRARLPLPHEPFPGNGLIPSSLAPTRLRAYGIHGVSIRFVMPAGRGTEKDCARRNPVLTRMFVESARSDLGAKPRAEIYFE